MQVVVPYKTESYSSQNDPEDNTQIPHCTLKMFPEEPLHCIEWARDKFGKQFTQDPNFLNKVLTNPNFKAISTQDISSLKTTIKMMKKRPKTFEDCILIARKKFEKYFVNDIKQLMHVYPIEIKNKDGTLFWSFPKRPPKVVLFDPKNQLHASFVSAFACLFARMFKIEILPLENNPRSEEFKFKVAECASKLKIEEFKLSDSKAKEIASQVEKEASKEEKKEEASNIKEDDIERMVKALADFKAILTSEGWKSSEVCHSEEFEKDDDSNMHIDYIYSLSNLRSKNYGLEEISWLETKLKAGRIIPALATTTASIAGLQSLELIKLIAGSDISKIRNTFLNLAVPLCTLSEPGSAIQIQLSKELKVTLWDRWEIKSEVTEPLTFAGLLSEIERRYKLYPRDVLRENQPIYLSALMEKKEKLQEKENLVKKSLNEILMISKEKYVDLTITMSEDKIGKILPYVPKVRILFE